MNKRQTQKHYKRKWQTLLAGMINKTVNTHIKPSRLKLHATQDAGRTTFICVGGGYELKFELSERGKNGTIDA